MGNGDDGGDGDDGEDDGDDHDDDTEYDGVKEPNTGENVSPANPTVAKLVVVRLRILFL